VAYIGHIISKAGVVMDQQKVRVVLEWPVPYLWGNPFCWIRSYRRSHDICGSASSSALIFA
jgi:hypothetical protein